MCVSTRGGSQFPSVLLKPLGHLSVKWNQQFTGGRGFLQSKPAGHHADLLQRRSCPFQPTSRPVCRLEEDISKPTSLARDRTTKRAKRLPKEMVDDLGQNLVF